MTEANSSQVALKNLREFQEMSYSDVYALIRQKRFDEAKAKYCAVLENVDSTLFSAALNLNISTPHDTLLDLMSSMAGSVANPDAIAAVGFDLSAHEIYDGQHGDCGQGIELSLYSADAFDFANASDEQIWAQCEATASEWQGSFMEVVGHPLDGLGPITQQFLEYARSGNENQGIVQGNDGAVVDPIAIAKHVAKLLVAIEYHRYMAEFVAEVEVPSQMVFIIGEHDEIEVPIVFYRVEPATELLTTDTPAMYDESNDEMSDNNTTAAGLGTALYEQAKANAEKAHGVPPINEEKVNLEEIYDVQPMHEETEEFSEALTEEPTYVEVHEEKPVPSAKELLGLTIEPKTFGQRSNKLLKEDVIQQETS